MAKAKPGIVTFASASTSQLVSAEVMASMAGIKMTNVPYKSGPAAMTDLIGGQVNMFSADFAVMLPQVKGGKVRGLAVTSSQRSKSIPELPTVNEALGLKDYELIAYFAVFAPAGTPADIIQKLNKAINTACSAKIPQFSRASCGSVSTCQKSFNARPGAGGFCGASGMTRHITSIAPSASMPVSAKMPGTPIMRSSQGLATSDSAKATPMVEPIIAIAFAR